MELSDIEKLLEKYFDGETTLSEEKELKVYFTGENVPPHLEKYKDLFQFYSNEVHVRTSSEIMLSSPKKSWYRRISIAASVAIIAGLFFTNDIQKPGNKEVATVMDTYENPELALEKTKEVLHMVAQLMNESKKDLVYLNEFTDAKRNLVYLNEFESAKNKLIK
ncbi:hypothetical protein AB832_04820 [Flavobacteriaceae bacterium (ex Bugula neritina AB1)]|nr:hypothetical protein AB832_04820 [Flavobacteriaceae bacterium (ex Bugula neritina AB1)]